MFERHLHDTGIEPLCDSEVSFIQKIMKELRPKGDYGRMLNEKRTKHRYMEEIEKAVNEGREWDA